MSSKHLRVPLSDLLDACPAAGRSRGLCMVLARPEGLTHSRGFGVIVEVGTEPDIDTVCAIPSMTKSLAVCAALIDRDRGLVDLDAPVTRYLPEHPTDGSDEAAPPTPRMLSSMRGVLTEDSAWVDPLVDFTAAELFSQLAGGVRYSRTPGTEYEYSNLGFGLAGLAVGRPIEDLIFSGICGPLGLSQTWFDGVVPDLATWTRTVGYPLDPDGRRATCPFAPTGEAQAAAGGMLSTVRDLSTWISSLGAAFRPPHRGEPQTLSRASCREVQRRHQIDLPSLNTVPTGGLHVAVSGYAPGLVAAYDLRRGMVISHPRGLPGYKLFMCRRPDSGTGIVCLTNSHRGDRRADQERVDADASLQRHAGPTLNGCVTISTTIGPRSSAVSAIFS